MDDATDGASSQATAPRADIDAALAYSRRASRITFNLNGRSVARRAESTVMPLRQEGAFEIAVAGVRQRLHASQGASYAPSYQFGAVADATTTPEVQAAQSHGDFANAQLSALASNSNVDWSWMLSRRVALSTFYNLQRTTFGRPGLDMTSQEAGARLSRRLTRYVSLRTGYAYRVSRAESTAGQPLRVNNVDAGIDFSRPLTQSKRTMLSFGSGSSLAPADQRMALNLTGDATLTRLIGRTWSARLAVNRGVRLVEGFTEPVLDNAVTTTLAGNLRRRVSLSMSGSLSTGTVGLNGGAGNGFTNWTTASGVTIPLGRRTAFDAHYFCAGHRFEERVALPPGLANERLRQGVRVGVTWSPALLRN
jgi:hypothetical protein